VDYCKERKIKLTGLIVYPDESISYFMTPDIDLLDNLGYLSRAVHHAQLHFDDRTESVESENES